MNLSISFFGDGILNLGLADDWKAGLPFEVLHNFRLFVLRELSVLQIVENQLFLVGSTSEPRRLLRIEIRHGILKQPLLHPLALRIKLRFNRRPCLHQAVLHRLAAPGALGNGRLRPEVYAQGSGLDRQLVLQLVLELLEVFLREVFLLDETLESFFNLFRDDIMLLRGQRLSAVEIVLAVQKGLNQFVLEVI